MAFSLLAITSFTTAAFAGVAAVTLSAPNFFFGPGNGVLSGVLFRRTYFAKDETALDPITYLFLRCAAAESVTVCLAYFLRVLGSKDDDYKRAYARVCLSIHVTMLPLCLQNALDPSGVFVRISFVWQSIFNAAMIILTYTALKRDKSDRGGGKPTKLVSRSSSASLKYDEDTIETQRAANQITAVFIGCYALPAYLLPNEFYGPDGIYPLFHRTTNEFNELDPIEVFAMRVMASVISYGVLQNSYLTQHTPSLLNKMHCVTNMFLLHPIMEQARSNGEWSVRWTFGGFCALVLILRYVQFRAAGFFDTIGQPAAAAAAASLSSFKADVQSSEATGTCEKEQKCAAVMH
eukprot:CAMPEP_0181039124 /NCGR_PEP_ID=MMETSP1070-20121207/10298_1 /TAXON_ID=265543 /ORGANISM="Minutocellus polymorphus, Strain NH13" /LENGTH=348 /DNA_ID=CAMNT_0023116947 /DNA_START=84 /DNA_END=1129 /DNA_ORIENTATION=+